MNDGLTMKHSRRGVLAGGVAVAAAAAVAPRVAAQLPAPARWRRYNVASAEGQMMLGHYQAAIAAMLKLPPEDPCNWYRTAFVHFLDCPHGNWWLFPWHRGITGWTEQMVRRLSGFEGFAFPYWDWTANPEVPAALYQGLLNPGNPAFIGDATSFSQKFRGVLTAAGYWAPGSTRLQQLTERGITSEDVLWDQILNPQNPDYPAFFPVPTYPNVRNPDARLDCVAANAVSSTILQSAMAAQDYETFSSPAAPNHSVMKGFAVLEGYPHNKVHNNTGGIVHPIVNGQCDQSTATNTGGLMQAFLSPVDPLFFLHHSNIDRLWDAWTQRQIAAGLPYLPQADFDAWAKEEFLFFSDADGKPVTKTHAGDYAAIGDFAYDYQPGSTGAPMPGPVLKTTRRPPVLRFAGEVPAGSLKGAKAMSGGLPTAVRLQPALLQLIRPGAPRHLLAKVTLVLPHAGRGQEFPVLVDTGDRSRAVQVGSVALFGHTMAHGPLTFTLPLDGALATLRTSNALKANGLLNFRAIEPVPRLLSGTAAATPPIDVEVLSVVIEAH